MKIYKYIDNWYIVQYKNRYIGSTRTREQAIELGIQHIKDTLYAHNNLLII